MSECVKIAKKYFSQRKISTVCRILGVSRSSYYRQAKEQKEEEKQLEQRIISTFAKHKGNYGRIRIKKALEREHIKVSEWKIARIMKENGLIAKGGRKKGRGKRSKMVQQEKIIKQNVIKDKFAVKEVDKLWSSDISEFKITGGKVYVCGIRDVASRVIVGWSIQLHMREVIVHQALKMACGRHVNVPAERYMHTDGGSQFCSKKTTELIEKAGFIKSMSRPGVPQDNQPIESFWKTMKREMPSIRHMKFEQAKATIVEYIELYYNSERLHSSINYRIPNEAYQQLSI